MKRIFKALTLAAVASGVSLATTAYAQETQSVGDLSAYVDPEDSDAVEYDTADYQPYEQTAYSDSGYGDSGYGDSGYGVARTAHQAPMQRLRSVGSNNGGGASRSGNRRGGVGAALAGNDDKAWLSAELLLWFPEARTSPTLAASAPAGGVFAGQPGYTPLFGGRIDSGMQTGFRADVGRYFASGQIGVGARLWFLTGADESFSVSSTGTPSLARPFFNTNIGSEDSLLAAINPGLEGNISAESQLDIYASEIYAKFLFMQGSEYRVDLLGGYSYFNIEDSLTVRNASTVIATGQVRRFRDSFDTANNFHGGQIGFQSQLERGRFSMQTLTKVHLGNMKQRVDINGASDRSFLGVPGIEEFKNGLFAMDNQGRTRRDVFAFAPEANLKLNYRMRDHVQFSVGYSFIYWSRVALAGDQIDRNVNPSGILSNVAVTTSPSRLFVDRGFFVHGLDLGITVDY